ncbi:hypothetical protein M2463_002994 [Parabacteroides sp. PH5-13]|uniref:TlpA family protein disulfide reductase n=1 Tax=unclassified Parabacteroides TaxID=2649774 RepID=UPI0024754E35|nr:MULTISPECIES: thioredoxin-like domain-containing protein [unclassified Parabacteroides]MDH6306316.1 hypothetical protein [Parabacteroides sp. PH5-39]MDH6320962.1 hypothetical protein [Parabacteroides sp. PH5-13]MDH6324694.1 hypothetical protein [Parabacteroides sp. PH5-8]MDH6385871.1 hypothetical protein [Parabacteroides sp. PH5-17]MDH6395162.1 hypothetical protein [Parabacteroides sp. PFB2-22]
MLKYITILCLVWLPAIASCRTIDVRLPSYAGREYSCSLFEGAKQDTIAKGTLDADGTAVIRLSGNYRGVARFSVKDAERVWNVVVEEAAPSGSPQGGGQEAALLIEEGSENSFLLRSMERQNSIIREYLDATNVMQRQSIEAEYKAFRKEITDSPLYAARLLEILNLLTGVGSSFTITEEEMLEEQYAFVVDQLDFIDLYSSGFWEPVFELWMQQSYARDTVLVADARRMIDSCGHDIPVRREVTQAIIRMFSKYAKDNLLAELGVEYLTMPLNGQAAPEIVQEGTDTAALVPVSSLIVFYETGCGNCHYELEQLKEKYKLLTDNNIRVISIAADIDKDLFEATAHSLPWTDKLCDLKGFEGENFRHYGIVGTPTYILTDSEGIVRGRYAQLKKLLP